ncbi:hypothetical protein ACRAQ6_04800 [Erythrobacter sp. HA6-11]
MDRAAPSQLGGFSGFLTLVFALFVCIFITQWLHELGHALAAVGFGYEVELSSNRVAPTEGPYATDVHRNLISMAGPAVTVLIAIAAYIWRARLGWLAPIVLWNTLTMRVLATLASINSPNDEARVSLSLGLGAWTLPLIVCAFLLALFVIVARERGLGKMWYLAAWIGMSLGYGVVVFGEKWLPSFIL